MGRVQLAAGGPADKTGKIQIGDAILKVPCRQPAFWRALSRRTILTAAVAGGRRGRHHHRRSHCRYSRARRLHGAALVSPKPFPLCFVIFWTQVELLVERPSEDERQPDRFKVRLKRGAVRGA